ncbi:hypothetical protein [Frankia gtarii]|uniref:hypothetical protein n=1 Tax=Frankia gtarii TaxID=2950102 RepID=UPI0034D3CCB4
MTTDKDDRVRLRLAFDQVAAALDQGTDIGRDHLGVLLGRPGHLQFRQRGDVPDREHRLLAAHP